MVRTETITSAANPLLKDIRRAAARGTATAEGFWIAESFHLLAEAIRSDCRIPVVVMAESARERVEPQTAALADTRLLSVPDPLFNEIASTEATQGVMALVRPPLWHIDGLFTEQTLLVVLDGIQDPGNAGAIARAAEAFGATGLIFLRGCAAPANPKTLRASAGSLFRLPFITGMDPLSVRATMAERSIQTYAALPFTGAEHPPHQTDFGRQCALVIGSEAHGVCPELSSAAEPVAIQTIGVESLNAAVAAAVLLYEASRQRVPEAVPA